jgi:hypothetical protein
MNKDKMANLILEELTHIDDGERHSPQALLRMLYGVQRRKQLEKDADSDRGVSLRKALARTQREYPYFIAGFDASYFQLAGARLSAGRGAPASFRAARDPGFSPARHSPQAGTRGMGALS